MSKLVKLNFALTVNKTVLGWDSLSHHCRNISSSSCKPFNGGIQKCTVRDSWKTKLVLVFFSRPMNVSKCMKNKQESSGKY